MVVKAKKINKTIGDYLSETEILAQLAEEASELAQAALKLRRAKDGINPTSIDTETARNDLLEEIADVQNCLEALELDFLDRNVIRQTANEKYKRWLSRLRAKQE